MKSKTRSIISRNDIVELANHLRLEHLFISSEKKQIQKLNEKVISSSERVFHLSWIISKQHSNLEQLLRNQKDINPRQYCLISSALDRALFIDSYKKFGSSDSQLSDILSKLRNNPKLVSSCLINGIKLCPELTSSIIPILISSLYSDCLLQEDTILVLQLLRQLLVYEIGSCENPRRLLRHGTCAYSQVYKLFLDTSRSAKIFLTVALREAIVTLLAEDDLFLDIDPLRAVQRFSQEERARHFGKENTPTYAEALQQYRSLSIMKLSSFVMKFITDLQSSMNIFPEHLRWLVKQISSLNERYDEKERGLICVDVIFTYFICHAIVNPEWYGIVDLYVSHIGRFNLMQVAQIIQALVLSKWEPTDPKQDDLYGKFPPNCLSSLLDFLLNDHDEQQMTKGSSVNTAAAATAAASDQLLTSTSSACEVMRTCVLMTDNDLQSLFMFLDTIKKSCKEENETNRTLNSLLSDAGSLEKLINHQLNGNSAEDFSQQQQQQQQKNSVKKTVLSRVTARKSSKSESTSNETIVSVTSCFTGPTSKIADDNNSEQIKQSKMEVYVIPLADGRAYQSLGMMSEDKVLLIEQQKRHTKVRMNLDIDHCGQMNDDSESIMSNSTAAEKKSRFSQDQESVAASDNLEAVSEAASNHSSDSSIDSENENDNLSDMVSANVSSGRGTPNVSGRETPSSESAQSEPENSGNPEPVEINERRQENVNQNNIRHRQNPNNNINNNDSLNSIPVEKPNRLNNSNDIEEKFGKFDCKPVNSVDETKSLLSDTWSTDVLASDSEALEGGDRDQAAIINQLNSQSHTPSGSLLFNSQSFPTHPMFHNINNPLDTSETASQSDAWSTDVLASDTERLQEFDLDDSSSLTKTDEISNEKTSIDKNEKKGVSGGDGGAASAVAFKNSSDNLMYFDDDLQKDGTIRQNNRKGKVFSNHLVDMNGYYQDEGYNTNSNNINNTGLVSSNSIISSSMQTLGRLSFDVRRLPASDDDPASIILPYLSSNADSSSRDLVRRGSSITELLSIDFITKNIESNQKTTSEASSTDSLNLIEFEKEIETIEYDLTRVSSSDVRINDEIQENQINGTDQSKKNSAFICSTPIIRDRSDTIVSTGAIPKIRNNRIGTRSANIDDDSNSGRSGRRGFFKIPNIKNSLKEKMKSFNKDKRVLCTNDVTVSESRSSGDSEKQIRADESTDAILEKYRERRDVTLSAHNRGSDNQEAVNDINEIVSPLISTEDETAAFEKVKRILRYVLCLVETDTGLKIISSNSFSSNGEYLDERTRNFNGGNELVTFLRVLIADAKYMQNTAHVAALQESIRLLETFDEKSSQKLFWSIREDYQRRAPYIAYLIRSRQTLLATLAQFDKIYDHLVLEKSTCNYNFTSILSHIFLEKKERAFKLFVKRFRSLTVSDEKVQLVEKFLHHLYTAMEPDSVWQVATDEQLETAKAIIERFIMSQVYMFALYPNGDGDLLRDKVLHQHIQKLAKVLTPDHHYIRIPKKYHSECPWPLAQEEILTLNAYKTPRDKVRCIVRTATIIMNLLSLVNIRCVPAADDFIPVLVYVLIKANPASLLSNVQYVNSFFEKQIEGEDAYWWIQFTSAVEFIKTMDY